MESQRNKEPPLCANGCGFYGTVQNRNLCSKCYEEYQQQEENASSFLHGKVKCSRLLKHHQRSILLTEVSNTVEEDTKKLKLYSYWRSSCPTRVRIALNLKGLSFDYVAVNMAKGEHLTAEYLKLNPLGYVPVLVDGDTVVFDSFAILMYLDDKYPQHPLLPHDLQKKAINYQVANIVSSRIQPLQNQPMLNFVEGKVGLDEKLAWAQYHIGKGFAALEKLLKDHAGRYATGDEVFPADIFLAAQIHPAIKKFNVDMTQFPLLLRLYAAYNEIQSFQNAMPEKQPDTPPSSTS
ncbi:glutathione S-transferase zeta class-like [Hevea brasiliensis]|uniref:glutathione S-transferase zeta class-like n=1 Tax=Hevea brasiliensis TaxID=3981 RepID=UPI0025D2D7FC|nr:glutathione S-transferase zeta class-like [Hevea brasiliensis]